MDSIIRGFKKLGWKRFPILIVIFYFIYKILWKTDTEQLDGSDVDTTPGQSNVGEGKKFYPWIPNQYKEWITAGYSAKIYNETGINQEVFKLINGFNRTFNVLSVYQYLQSTYNFFSSWYENEGLVVDTILSCTFQTQISQLSYYYNMYTGYSLYDDCKNLLSETQFNVVTNYVKNLPVGLTKA